MSVGFLVERRDRWGGPMAYGRGFTYKPTVHPHSGVDWSEFC